MKTFFEEMRKSIMDFKFYKDAKDFEIAKSVKYILVLMFVIGLVLTLRYIYPYGKGITMFADWAKRNLPPIEIQDGIVKVDVKQPYKVTEGDFTLIIDTTGQVTSLDEYPTAILLMKNKAVVKNELKTEIRDLSNVKLFRLNENFINGLQGIMWVVFFLMAVLFYIYFCLTRFFHIFLFSGISMVAASIAKSQLTYKQIFNIGAYAITLSTLYGGLIIFFGTRPPLALNQAYFSIDILYCILYIAYLVAAVMNCKEAE